MSGRIKLTDLDRPDEPFEVEIAEYGPLVLRLGVPNTIVSFEMRRASAAEPYEGAIGGRNFLFDPNSMPKRRTRKK